jgi:PleD family two-component response regulator
VNEEVSMTGHDKNSILIVDDNPDNLRLLSGILSTSGYRVRPVSNGAHAIVSIEKESPALILLDIMMPGMDGYEVCRELKSNEQTASIPIIFISALDEISNKTRAFSIGGVDYITKPFNSEEVLARIKTHLTMSQLVTELEERNRQLQQALDEIKTLRGIIPICANCKNIRDDKGYWHQIEVYVRDHSDADFSHGICQECAKKLYPDLDLGLDKE